MIVSLVEDQKGEWEIKLTPNLDGDLGKIDANQYDAGRVGLLFLNMADILLRTFVGEVRQIEGETETKQPGEASRIVIPPAGIDLSKLPRLGGGGG